MSHKIMVAAVAKNGVIGANNQLPWSIKEEMSFFRAVTLGKAVVMGRKTAESLNRPLPHRHNYFISSNPHPELRQAGFMHGDSLEQVLFWLERHFPEMDIAIMGGANLYEQAFPFVDGMWISRLNFEAEGDTVFPEIPEYMVCVERLKFKEFIAERYVSEFTMDSTRKFGV